MRPEAFANSPSGILVPTEQGQRAFVPNPLPPKLDPAEYVGSLETAASAIGELNGIGRTLDNPYLLIRPMQTKEALTSSSMEGTYTTVDDLLLFEAGAFRSGTAADTREVSNYRRALSNAISSLTDLPLCLRTLRNAHRTLLHGVGDARGLNKRPGEFKVHQNFIGAFDIEGARFIPPPPDHAVRCLNDLEAFIHRERDDHIPLLIESALIHYQFETIHPFADGNGRVGRMLITIHLFQRELIKQPILYLSPYLEEHRDEYIDLMYEVSRSGAWGAWIEFYLGAVTESARQTVAIADRLFALQRQYRSALQGAGRSANLLAISDHLFIEPVFTIPGIASLLGVTYRAAQLNVKQIEKAGLIREIENTSNPRFYVAPGILAVIRGEFEAGDRIATRTAQRRTK
jgi:Fic family protein